MLLSMRMHVLLWWGHGGGRHLTFLGMSVRPRFPKCKTFKLIIASEHAENEERACELKNFQIWGFRIWAKREAVGAKILFLFLDRGSCKLIFTLIYVKYNPTLSYGRVEMGVKRDSSEP